MVVITCKNCGNDIVVGPGVTLAICKECGCRHVIVGQEGTNGPTVESLVKR